MPTLRITTTIDHKLLGQIQKGVIEATEYVINTFKEELHQYPVKIWDAESRGGDMQEELELTGLSEYTKPGQLSEAWHRTIDGIKLDRRFNKVTINWFNSYELDEGTKWIGLSEYPRFNTDKRNKKQNTLSTSSDKKITKKLLNNPTLMVNGLRPLSKGTKRYWTWNTNPYADHGYWMLYDQGFDTYEPNPFIQEAYRTIFGQSAANLFSDSGNISFTPEALADFGNQMSIYINSEVKK